MIKTFGLTHIALSVKDVDRSARFYNEVFGAKEMYRHVDFIQVQTPGSRDLIVFQKGESNAGKEGGIMHFGFRLTAPANVEEILKIVEAAGGTIKETGEFAPGEFYVFFYDPDGYEIEVCYENLPPELSGEFN